MSKENNTSLDDFDLENGPLVIKRHAFMGGPYLPQFESHVYVDYYIMHFLRMPILSDAIKYYEENYRQPIIRQLSDGTITYVKDRLEALNEARATGSKHLLIPLRLQTRRFYNVTLDDIALWQQQINQEQKELEDVRVPVPLYENTKLPVIEEWLGLLNNDRRSVIRLIAEATNDLANLHEYISTNPGLYGVNEDDDRGHNQNDNFLHYNCSRFWCSACYQFIRLPSRGSFVIGEKLTDISKPMDRFELAYLNEALELLQKLTWAIWS